MLLDPIDLRGLHCPNRIFMAPLTRQRASTPGDIPGALQAEHYAQRASFGLLITEATQISPEGKGWRDVLDGFYDADGGVHPGREVHY